MGAGRVLCDDVLRRRMRTCVLSVPSTVDPSTTSRSRHFGAETKMIMLMFHFQFTSKNLVMHLSCHSYLLLLCTHTRQGCRKQFSGP